MLGYFRMDLTDQRSRHREHGISWYLRCGLKRFLDHAQEQRMVCLSAKCLELHDDCHGDLLPES